MKHISLRHIGKKLAALSMAAVAAVTLMLSTAPVMTASAGSEVIYTPDDEIIPLPAPVYNWANSKKVLTFDVKKAENWFEGNVQHVYGREICFLDKYGLKRTKNARFLYVKTDHGYIEDHGTRLGTLTAIGDGWYHAELEIWKMDRQMLGNYYDPELGLNPYLPSNKVKTQKQSKCGRLLHVSTRTWRVRIRYSSLCLTDRSCLLPI